MTGRFLAEQHGSGSIRPDTTTPPYVSFNTFRTLLEWLKTEGVPLHFDRSFWQAKFSGSTGSQLVATLKFLGLLNGDRPVHDLENLVDTDVEERRLVLRDLVRDSYGTVHFDKLDRATPAMLRSWFSSYPIDGHTLRKAISFFVNAAKEAEIPISNAVSKMSKNKLPKSSNTSRDRHSSYEPVNATSDDLHQSSARKLLNDHSAATLSRTMINLRSGGAVTVNLAVDLFRLSDQDREFVLKLVEHTRSYQIDTHNHQPN